MELLLGIAIGAVIGIVSYYIVMPEDTVFASDSDGKLFYVTEDGELLPVFIDDDGDLFIWENEREVYLNV